MYNEQEIREDSKWSSYDLSDYVKKQGYNLWIDLTTSTSTTLSHHDLERIKQSFRLDEEAIKAVKNGSKNPHARILKDHIFTIFADLEYRNIRELETNAIYFFLGKGWLITIHNKETSLVDIGKNA